MGKKKHGDRFRPLTGVMTPLQTAELHGLYIHGDYGRDDVASGAESSRKKWLDRISPNKLADMLPEDSSVRDDEIETGNPTKTKRLEMTSLSSSTGPFSGANS